MSAHRRDDVLGEARAAVPFRPLESGYRPSAPCIACLRPLLPSTPDAAAFLESIAAFATTLSTDEALMARGHSTDELVALIAYTADVTRSLPLPQERNLYFRLNAVLRSRAVSDIVSLRDWYFYLVTGLAKVPLEPPSTVWRGLDCRLTAVSAHYRAGVTVCWTSFTSLSTHTRVMEDFARRKKAGVAAVASATATGGGTMVQIKAIEGRSLRPYSMYDTEEEVILAPNALLKCELALSATDAAKLSAFPGCSTLPVDVDLIVMQQLPTPSFASVLPSPAPAAGVGRPKSPAATLTLAAPAVVPARTSPAKAVAVASLTTPEAAIVPLCSRCRKGAASKTPFVAIDGGSLPTAVCMNPRKHAPTSRLQLRLCGDCVRECLPLYGRNRGPAEQAGNYMTLADSVARLRAIATKSPSASSSASSSWLRSPPVDTLFVMDDDDDAASSGDGRGRRQDALLDEMARLLPSPTRIFVALSGSGGGRLALAIAQRFPSCRDFGIVTFAVKAANGGVVGSSRSHSGGDHNGTATGMAGGGGSVELESFFQYLSRHRACRSVNLVVDQVSADAFATLFAKGAPLSQTIAELSILQCDDPRLNAALAHIVNVQLSLTFLSLDSCSKVGDADATHLAKLTKLTSLHLGGCNVGDTGLLTLARGLPCLTTLGLEFCGRITETGLEQLASSCPALTALNLWSCTRVNDAALLHLSKLRALKTLDLTSCTDVTDAGLQYLSRLPALAALDLDGCLKIGDPGLVQLGRVMSLTSLNFAACRKMTDFGLAALSTLTTLKTLNLRSCGKITDAGAAHIAKLASLTWLDMEGCAALTDDGLSHISASLTKLTFLNLEGCSAISDVGLTQIAHRLESLASLSVWSCAKITDAGVAEVAQRLPNLTSLDVRRLTALTDAALLQISHMRSLTSLDFRRAQDFTDAGLISLSVLKNIVSLHFEGCMGITDAGITQYVTSTEARLEALSLTRVSMTDVGLKQLALHMASLTSLDIAGCRITDVGLADIGAQLTDLTVLTLTGCLEIGDAGLVGLAMLPRLASLDLWSCSSVTDAGMTNAGLQPRDDIVIRR